MSDFEPLLAEAIGRTGIVRYRYLCLEHPSRGTREAYRKLVREIAAEPRSINRAIAIGLEEAAVMQEPRKGGCCGGNPYG